MPIAMQIKDRPEYTMKGPTVTFTKEKSVLTASIAMSEKNIGSCVVVDEDQKPIGIVTERDLMHKIVAKELKPSDTPLADIMTTNVKVAKPEDKIVDWLRQMSNERFRRVPVVDEDGKVVNIMTQGDFVSYTWPELYLGRNRQLIYIFIGLLIYTFGILMFL